MNKKPPQGQKVNDPIARLLFQMEARRVTLQKLTSTAPESQQDLWYARLGQIEEDIKLVKDIFGKGG